jgi:hypothetical protein
LITDKFRKDLLKRLMPTASVRVDTREEAFYLKTLVNRIGYEARLCRSYSNGYLVYLLTNPDNMY